MMTTLSRCLPPLAAGMAALTLMAASPALAQAPAPGKPPGPTGEFRAYLASSDLDAAMAPTARAGSPRADFDAAVRGRISPATAGPLWELARKDAGRGVLDAFSCALDATLNKDRAPHLVVLLTRLRTDVLNATRQPAAWGEGHKLSDAEKDGVCLTPLPNAPINIDQPSVQATWGWVVGLVLAEAAPQRSGPILQRARVYGDGAAACGVGTVSAVRAGRDVASGLLAVLHADPGFQADLAAVRREIAGLTAASSPPTAATCAAERATLALMAY